VALQFPVPGQQLVDAPGRMILQARQHIGQPSLGINVVELGGLCRPPNYAEPARYGMSLSRWHR